MCDFFEWKRGDDERDEAFQSFRIALTKQFNTKYGTDVDDLAAWQSLCVRLGIDPVPSKIKQCREVYPYYRQNHDARIDTRYPQIVTGTHVNLVDLVDNSATLRIFSSVEELSSYSRSSGKIFPREMAYAGELLRYLLRHIMDPSRDSRRGESGQRGQRGRGRGGRGRGTRGGGRSRRGRGRGDRHVS